MDEPASIDPMEEFCRSLQRDRVKGTIAELRRRVRQNPHDNAEHHCLAVAYYADDRYMLASRAFRRCLKLSPHDSPALLNFALLLGTCPHFWVRDTRLAIFYAQQGLRLTSVKNWRGLAVCAAVYANADKWDLSLTCLRMSLDLAPPARVPHLQMRFNQYENHKKCWLSGREAVTRIWLGRETDW